MNINQDSSIRNERNDDLKVLLKYEIIRPKNQLEFLGEYLLKNENGWIKYIKLSKPFI